MKKDQRKHNQSIFSGKVDYRQFRLSKLNTPEFQHLRLLLFWPLFGILFYLAERGNLTSIYFPMHCALDDKIPFCEWFLIPYLFWFVFLAGMHLYLLLFDVPLFEDFMRYIIITYSAGLIIFFLFPTCQYLRPSVFPRDNILTQMLASFYAFDTSTNVCPSLHVVGSLAVTFAGWRCKKLQSMGWKLFFGIAGVLVSISTVFVKQHSAIDLAAGLIICVLAYPLIYGKISENAAERSSVQQATSR